MPNDLPVRVGVLVKEDAANGDGIRANRSLSNRKDWRHHGDRLHEGVVAKEVTYTATSAVARKSGRRRADQVSNALRDHHVFKNRESIVRESIL